MKNIIKVFVSLFFLFAVTGCETGRQLILNNHKNIDALEEEYINESSKKILENYGFFNNITNIINNDTQYFNYKIKNESEPINTTKYLCYNIYCPDTVYIEKLYVGDTDGKTPAPPAPSIDTTDGGKIGDEKPSLTQETEPKPETVPDSHDQGQNADTPPKNDTPPTSPPNKFSNDNYSYKKNILNYDFTNIMVDNLQELKRVLKKIFDTDAALLKDEIVKNIIYVGLVEFSLGSSKINTGFDSDLIQFSDLIDTFGKNITRLEISGNTDDLEFADDSKYDNWNLSKNRADSVFKFLKKLFEKNNNSKFSLEIRANSNYFPYYNIPDEYKNISKIQDKNIHVPDIAKKINEYRQKNRRVDIIIHTDYQHKFKDKLKDYYNQK